LDVYNEKYVTKTVVYFSVITCDTVKKWFAELQWFVSHGFQNTDPEHNDLVLYKFSDIPTSFQVLLKMSDD